MVLFMNYRRNNKRFSVAGRGEYLSTFDFIVKYYTNLEACYRFFFDMKWPTGYYCEKMWMFSLLLHEIKELLSLYSLQTR